LEARILLDGDDPPYDPAPFANDDYFFLAADYNQTYAFYDTVTSNDDCQSGDVFSVVDEPEYGTLVMQPNGDFSYMPDGENPGYFWFTYQIDDGVNLPAVAIAWLEIYNPPPEAFDDGPYFSLDQGTMTVPANKGLLENDSKDSRETNTATKLTDPQHGSVTVNSDGSFSYTPEPLYPGLFWFQYEISDGAGNGLAGTSQAFAYVYVGKVEIARTDTYAGLDAWIGETVTLEASIPGYSGSDPVTYDWSVPTKVVSGYVFDNDRNFHINGDGYFTDSEGNRQPEARVIPLEGDLLKSSSVTAHWIDDGAKQVSVQVTIGGQTATATKTITVSKPAQLGSSATIRDVEIFLDENYAQNGVGLGHFPGGNQTGWQWGWELEATLPDPLVGQYWMTSKATINATRILNDESTQTISGTGGDGQRDPLEYSPAHWFSGKDAPSVGLFADMRWLTVAESFTTTVMWKGPRPGIFVPHEKIEWDWWATVERQDGVWGFEKIGGVDQKGGTINTSVASVPTTEFPEFYGEITWVLGGKVDGDWGGWQPVD